MGVITNCVVGLRILGADLDPEKIEHLLGCVPSAAAKTGDVIPKRHGDSHIVRRGYWRLEYGKGIAAELDDKVESLLGKLTSDLGIWRQITEKYKVDIFCGVFLDSLNQGFNLSPHIMKKLGERNLKIGFDIYAPTEDVWQDV